MVIAPIKRLFSRAGRRHWLVLGLVGLLMLAGTLPLLAHAWLQPVEFNQFSIQRANVQYGVSRISASASFLRSAFSSGWNILLRRPERAPPDYFDSNAMFSYVFSWLPGRAIAYPTEAYYYFSFLHPGQGLVCGSIRLSDLDQGHVVFNYFRLHEGGEGRALVSEWITDITIDCLSPYAYDVSHRGRTVRFQLLDREFLNRLPDSPRLPEEEFVTRMHDESGLRFIVYFNHATASFYYVLDEEDGTADTLEPFGEDGHLRGRRTGFMFYDDVETSRKILVGVSFASVKRNDYFDGPGDQLPFRLQIRDKLHIAYPSTNLGEGVNEHGVLEGSPRWARFIISAYHLYANPEEMLEYNRVAVATDWPDKSDLWTALTKEWWHTREWREDQYRRLEEEGKRFHSMVDRASRPEIRTQRTVASGGARR